MNQLTLIEGFVVSLGPFLDDFRDAHEIHFFDVFVNYSFFLSV